MRSNLEEDLKYARIKKTKQEWLKYSAAAGTVGFTLATIVGQHLLAPLLAILAFAAVYKYPWYKRKQIAGAIEKELPLTLRSIATLVSIGLPFEEALRQCGDGNLPKQFEKALRETELGASIPEALSSMAKTIDSQQLQRAIMQLNTLYAKKGSTTSLKKLSEELVSVQKAALREYSGKLVVYSLLFIAASALLPALFQAYVIVGSTFMTSLTPEQAFWIPVAVFPLVDAGALVFIRLKKPFFA